MEKTLAIIKPDALKRNLLGKILEQIENNGFRIANLKMVHLKVEEAKEFYRIHALKPFYENLIKYISSDKAVAAILEKDNAVADWRKLMGATNPEEAEVGTIRKQFALNIEKNSVHGSDSPESAAQEISFFFPD